MLAVRYVFVKSFYLTLIIFRLQPPLWSTISTTMSIGFTAREVIPSESSGLISFLHLHMTLMAVTFAGFFICGMRLLPAS